MSSQPTTSRARPPVCGAHARAVIPVTRAGKLIYTLYGQKTEDAFVKNWGVGLAIEQAQSFQDLVSSAAQAFAILLLLDLLLVGPARWFEEVRVPSAHGAAGKASSVPAGH